MKMFAKLALMAALVVPAAAQAQSGREVRQGMREVQQDRNAVQDARMNGTQHDVRKARQELREDRQELREDRRDHRRATGQRYNRYNNNAYNRPYAQPYRYYGSGAILPRANYGSSYYFNDYARFRLPRLGYAQRYIRNGRDVLLVNTRNGRVVRIYRHFYR